MQGMGAAAALLSGRWGVGQQTQTDVVDKDRMHRPMRKLQPDEAVFFNSDHSPVGAHASLVYGMEASGGLTMLDVRRQRGRPLMVQDGILIGVREGASQKAKIMPFSPAISDPTLAEWSDVTRARRVLRACVDAWDMGYGVSWKHYTPYWKLDNLERARPADVARFLLPATWMSFDVDNTGRREPKTFIFSLLDSAPAKEQRWGDHHGYVLSKQVQISPKEGEINELNTQHSVALPARAGQLITAEEVRKKYGVAGATTAIEVEVPPGQRREFTIVLGHFNDQPLVKFGAASLYLTKFYASIHAVMEAAIPSYTTAKQCAERYQAEVKGWGTNEYRQFLFGHALASYMFNTRLFLGKDEQYLWSVIEGEYDYINTFDLVVDQVFLELEMHPWTVRNELDLYASNFYYRDRIKVPDSDAQVYDGGLTFHHDMGSGFSYKTPEQVTLPYPLMSQEELQNWILSAGLYWHKTGDHAWLEGKRKVLGECLASMLVRDDIEPAKRDGVTSFASTATAPPKAAKGGEITTYDSLDNSLKLPVNSGYIATKNFASYLALEVMFLRLGDKGHAETSRAQADRTARTIASHFDPTTKSFPARFGGEFDARTIPAVEGLAYPYLMGLKDAVSPTGPYGELVKLMRTHMDSILRKGICLDATSGAWKMSSSTTNTWESKIYLAQFVTEKVLGLYDDRTHGDVDGSHYQIQVLGNPATAWSDQVLSDVGSTKGGSRHYPRGVTSYLWSLR